MKSLFLAAVLLVGAAPPAPPEKKVVVTVGRGLEPGSLVRLRLVGRESDPVTVLAGSKVSIPAGGVLVEEPIVDFRFY